MIVTKEDLNRLKDMVTVAENNTVDFVHSAMLTEMRTMTRKYAEPIKKKKDAGNEKKTQVEQKK